MKILHIIQRYPPAIGGSEFWCSNISKFLLRRGVISKVATINLNDMEDFSKEPFLERGYIKFGCHDNDNGVFVKRFKLWSLWSRSLSAKIANFLLYRLKLDRTEIGNIFRNSPHSFEMYFKLFSEIRDVDIVHLHTLPYFHNIVGYIIAKMARKKIVITPYFHPGHIVSEKSLFYKMMNNCDAIITLTNYEKEYFIKRGINPDKIYITGCFVSEEDYGENEGLDNFRLNLFNRYGLEGNSKKIIFIGRKEMYKGIGTLIEAAKKIADEENINLCLFLVGPDTTEFSNSRYSKIDITKRLKVLNFNAVSEEEKINLLKLSDLLVLPSKFESFGIVFLEAWEYRKPVIGSNLGAMPEVIEEGGLCVKYGDMDDLMAKMREILFNQDFARKLGNAGRRKLERKYSLNRIGKKVFDIYNNVRRYKKKILVVSQLFPPYFIGGSEIVTYEQSKKLQNMNFEIKIFAGKLDNKTEQYRITKEKNEFRITRINLHSIDFDCNYASLDKDMLQEKFREELYNFAPDAVHFHNISSFSLKMIDECYKMHIPTLMTLHDFWGICFKNTLLNDEGIVCKGRGKDCIYCRKTLNLDNAGSISVHDRNSLFIDYLNKVDLLIAPSRYLTDRFIDCGVLKSKIKVIRYGIDTSRFVSIKKTKSKKIRFGYIGQIIHHKGIENLLESVSLLSDNEKSKISLLLVGSGEDIYVNYCKELVKQLKLMDLVTFCRKVNNNRIPKIYNNVDVLIVPSIWPDNAPVTIIEALAAGTPILASNIGGIPELVQDGVHGYLHKYSDPVSLKENIQKIIRNPELLKGMKEACLEKARSFDLTGQVKLIAEEYNSLM